MEAARFQERDVTTAGRVKPVIGYNQPSGGYGLNYDYGLYSLLHATLLLLLPLFFFRLSCAIEERGRDTCYIHVLKFSILGRKGLF